MYNVRTWNKYLSLSLSSPPGIVKYPPLQEVDLVAYNKEIEFCLNPGEMGGAMEGEHFRKIWFVSKLSLKNWIEHKNTYQDGSPLEIDEFS